MAGVRHHAPEDALHTLVDTTLNGQPVVPNGMEATAALDPNFRSFGGYTRANLQALETIPLTTANLVNGWERRTANVTTGDQGGTYLLKGEGSLANHYDVLADTIFVDGDWDFEGRNADGKYLAPGGFLGAVAQKAWSMLPYDWSKPSFDGLGLPVDWVPPYEGELLGDHPGTATVQFYLGKAQAAADEASAAVRAAVDNLLKEEADAVALAAAQKKAATIDNLEQQSLCGEKAAKCDTRMVALDLRSRISPIDQTPGPDGRTCSNTICQVLQEAVLRVVPKSVSVGAAVADRINQDAVPSFDDYQGGELQRLFIQQWTAVTTLIRFVSFDTRLQAIAKMAAVDAAAATLQAANNTAALLCDHRTLRAAWDAGYSFQVDIEDEQLFFFDENGYSGTITHKNDGTSWSMGPLIAAINACQQSKIQLAPAAAQAAAVVSDAWSWASGQLTQITQHVADVRTSMANISGGIQKTKIAKASAALEADLVADQLTTRLGLARRFHSYDIWRAQALLENARRLSVAARRAIEATFVVDLSDMHAPEAFVREPAQWADDVYAHDLNAPASVGLQTPAQIAGGIYPNRLSDYVHNLDLFVQGYAITRPTASAKADAEIISLPPPEQVKSIEVSGGQKVDVLAAESAAWSFYCQADAMWIEHPGATETPLVSRLAQACNGVGPTKARLRFNLDPWARQNGDVAQPAFSARHNVRWRRLAVNVVGTGVRDCSKSLDPLSCFTEPFVKFDLRHVGPATVTDFDGRWHVLGIPTGVVESGKALAAEIWLDPVANGWSAPMVGAVARSEFLNRSVGGAYELELKLTPDVRLDRIERIQLLTESDYWVKQD